LSQIIEENKPDSRNVVVPDVAARIDAIVAEVAFSGHDLCSIRQGKLSHLTE
jgi:hypothetical protein